MCGIAAVIDVSESPGSSRLRSGARIGESMLERLHHRGPDGSGSRQVGATWLGHTRLSIVDLAGGAQPLSAGRGTRWAVVNGEIYNHSELRGDLPGHFRTRSDSETVLHLLDEHGPSGLSRLGGMWAFCVADEAGDVVVGRDAMGIKPLYWARHDGRLLVASELGAFPEDSREHVAEFPPGCFWTPASGLVRFAHPVTGVLDDAGHQEPPFATREEARCAVRETLVASVRERMMADIPVGVFLSGGLDSSIVAAILARSAPPGVRIRSFAAGTPDSSDLAAARRVADHLGLEHHERIFTADDVVAVLPDVVTSTESYEPSLIRSAVPNYLLSELASRHVKVVLTGEGADELFAGYHHLRELDEAALATALDHGVAGLHNLNLQRCDRVSMAHGLEARVPFLAREMVAVSRRIPAAWKLLGEEGQEKALLREAFEGWLPAEILWRRKEQFGDGSGTAAVMARRAESLVPEPDWRGHAVPGLPPARTREELGYQRIFAERLGGIRAERVLGRFAVA